METKRKKMFFCAFVFFLSLFLPLIHFQILYATTFISEKWDSGTPAACWPCKTSSPCESLFNGWEPIDWLSGSITEAGRSTTQYVTSPYSYRHYKKATWHDSCAIWHELPTHPTTIYVRFYMYMTGSGWSNWTGSDPLMHWMFTNTMMGSTGFRLNMTKNSHWGSCPSGDLCLLPEGDSGREWWSSTSPSWTSGASDDFLQYLNTWTCFEYKIQISGSNVILTEWINGILKRGPVTGPGSNKAYFDVIYIHLYDNQATNYVLEYYIDDLVVADQYIGPLGGSTTTTTAASTTTIRDTTAPAPPSGLRIE